MSKSSILGAVILIAIPFAYLKGSEPQDDKPTAVVEAVCWLEGDGGLSGNLRATADIGELPAGSKSHVAIRLCNSSSNKIPVTAISSSCGCIRITSNIGDIPAKGEFLVEFDVDVPSNANQIDQFQVFTLKTVDNRVIMTSVQYRISGLVSFIGRGFSTKVAVGAREHSFDIPILVTKPATLSNLDVQADESLGNIEIVPTEKDGQTFLACRIAFDNSIELGCTGKIVMGDPNRGASASTLCLIELKQALVVAPTILRFNLDDTDLPQFTATAIVQIDDSILSDRGEPLFSFATENGKISSTTKELSRGVYRVYLTWLPADNVKESEVEIFPSSVFCTAKTGNKIERKKVRSQFNTR